MHRLYFGKCLCFYYIYCFNVLYCVYPSGFQSSIRSLPCICGCFEWFSWSPAWFGQSGYFVIWFSLFISFLLSDIKISIFHLSVQQSCLVIIFARNNTYIFTIFCNPSALLLYSVLFTSVRFMQIRICIVLFTSIMMLQEVLRWIRSIVAEFGTPNISTEQLADYINKTLSKGQVMS